MNQSAFFDLYDLFVNELVGDIWLFVLLGLIVIWIQSAKSNLPHQVSTLFAVMWIAIVFSAAFNALLLLWVFIGLVAGGLFYYRISKRFRQG